MNFLPPKNLSEHQFGFKRATVTALLDCAAAWYANMVHG